MGRVNLRLFDATVSPSKPVYLRYRILEAGLGTSLRQSWDQAGPRDLALDLALDLVLDPEV